MRIATTRLTLLVALLASFAAAQARDVTVGIVTDGPQTRNIVPVDALLAEFDDLMAPEFDVRIPADKRLNGEWTTDGIRSSLQQLLDDPGVDVVIANGAVATSIAGAWPDLRKPVIGTVVIDAELQGFAGRSKPNFYYLSNFRRVSNDLTNFHDAIAFTHLAVLVNHLSYEALPVIPELAKRFGQDAPFSLTPVLADRSVEALVDSIPDDVDAVYITPLFSFSDDQMAELASRLIELRLPSFSMLGRGEVEQGFMMSTTGLTGDYSRMGRRIALTMQGILLGESDPVPVDVDSDSSRLLINMATARAIGLLPRWAVLTTAEVLYDVESRDVRSMTLLGAMRQAVQGNLNLKAARFDIDIAAQQVRQAKGALLPQLNASASQSRINAERANAAFQAENTGLAGLSASQVVYSDDAWAALAISEYLKKSSNVVFRGEMLDTLELGSISYLNLLSAKAIEQVRRSNLGVTRFNLDLAKAREAIGFSGRAEVLRLDSQIAADLQSLLQAQADRRNATIELNRVLNLSQDAAIETADPGLEELMKRVQDARFQAYVGNPAVWDVFQAFSVEQALENSTELLAASIQVQAQERQALANQRDFYVPDIVLSGSGDYTYDRSGRGSTPTTPGMLSDRNWTLLLEARLPVFSGGQRRATLAESRYQARQLQVSERSIAEQVEARARSALQRVRSSYPSIELSRDAAEAAQSNLELVTDSYSQGAVSITDLIDAQNAALSAELDAAVAVYAFFSDFMTLLRSQSDFDLIMDPLAWEDWLQALDLYFKEQGVEPLSMGPRAPWRDTE